MSLWNVLRNPLVVWIDLFITFVMKYIKNKAMKINKFIWTYIVLFKHINFRIVNGNKLNRMTINKNQYDNLRPGFVLITTKSGRHSHDESLYVLQMSHNFWLMVVYLLLILVVGEHLGLPTMVKNLTTNLIVYWK